MELGTRFVNAQVVELIARLGMHNWRLSDDERFFLQRYIYLSVLEALRTLGIRYNEQDPLLKTERVLPRQVPEFLRIPPIPTPAEDDTQAIILPIVQQKETNGRHV